MARADPPLAADERTMLLAFLDYQRESVLIKLEGLTEEQARWAPAPTANSLLSLVMHLAWVERWWFRKCFAGETGLDRPRNAENDPDADMRVRDDETISDVIAFYRGEWERANEIVRAAPSLDEPSKIPSRGEHPTLRWILNHMMEETARHAGHADITRELIDGTTGD